MVLTLTFTQGHTDLNHENNKCSIISETVQAMGVYCSEYYIYRSIYIYWGSETEWGLERFCRINKQREVIALEQLTSCIHLHSLGVYFSLSIYSLAILFCYIHSEVHIMFITILTALGSSFSHTFTWESIHRYNIGTFFDWWSAGSYIPPRGTCAIEDRLLLLFFLSSTSYDYDYN